MKSYENERYTGHMTLCEIDMPGHRAIRRGKVLAVGAGGLGSPVLMYLCSAGVGKIGVVDGDTVSMSNLQRQILFSANDLGKSKAVCAAERLRELNGDVDVETYGCFLDSENAQEIVSGYDIVVDCTDTVESRATVADVCERLGKPYVFGSVWRFQGMVFTYLPGTAGYRSFFTEEGKDEPRMEGCAQTGILNAVVGIVGSVQAAEVIKFLAGTGDLLTDKLLTVDALTMEFATLRMR